MKEEALKLADELDALHQYVPSEAPAMIRRLVEELDKATYVIEPKQTKPTITKLDGKVVAVTMTDDEHRVHEVLWEAPKPLSDEEIEECWKQTVKQEFISKVYRFNFARAILRKAQER